jgi:hypothetical protein
MNGRVCGDCQLCCRLLPVRTVHKLAGEKCRHQKHGKGCTIYRYRPSECRVWNCRWLVNDETEHLPRPDRAHYVVDVFPDFVHQLLEDGSLIDVPVMQVWCDPGYREAWRDPRLLAYIEKIAVTRRMATLIRYNSEGDSMTVFAPALCADGQWHEIRPELRADSGILSVLARGRSTPNDVSRETLIAPSPD